jgi:hypothetical protein
MMTFDEVIPTIKDVFSSIRDELNLLMPFVVNRDLNGRIRLVFDEKLLEQAGQMTTIQELSRQLSGRLGCHGYPADRMALFEPLLKDILQGGSISVLDGYEQVFLADRMASESDWSSISPVSEGPSRIAFYSIKGGVGRSTASAVVAWALAQSGKRVLVLDLDLESPGLSSSLLPEDRRPKYGIIDWLVEDLVDNGSAVLESMFVRSDLSHDGEIYVVPAHGADPGEYVSKLGRAWVQKAGADMTRESWSQRLNRLLSSLEERLVPDIVLLDTRAGIDEVASACLTDMGAKGILLFASDGEQTWFGYRMLLRYWNRSGVIGQIRDRLQLVGAMIPEVNSAEYFSGLNEHAWLLFTDEVYDEVPAGESAIDFFSFEQMDTSAPHYPLPVRWNRGFSSLQFIHGRLQQLDKEMITQVFGELIAGVRMMAGFEADD